MRRLTNKQIKNRIKQYSEEYAGTETKWKDVAIDLAKDFIYNAQLEFDHYLNNHYKELGGDTFQDRGNIWKVAIDETSQYLEDDF